MSTSVTSKTKVAFPGIVGGAPDLPYAFSGGMVSLLLPPTAIPWHPISQPAITSRLPRRNTNGLFTDESNTFPLDFNLPT